MRKKNNMLVTLTCQIQLDGQSHRSSHTHSNWKVHCLSGSGAGELEVGHQVPQFISLSQLLLNLNHLHIIKQEIQLGFNLLHMDGLQMEKSIQTEQKKKKNHLARGWWRTMWISRVHQHRHRFPIKVSLSFSSSFFIEMLQEWICAQMVSRNGFEQRRLLLMLENELLL